jgi:hypothetical protein
MALEYGEEEFSGDRVSPWYMSQKEFLREAVRL